jgi:SAM-dependent methyltransferase
VLDGVFGLELLQVGDWGASRELLACSRTQRQTLITQSAACPAGAVIARYDALPVQTASVDAVLLPHTLEFDPDPQALVREADRVLTGEGQLIILGFRPASLWGLRARAARGGYPPELKQLLSERRLRDWLGLLGYQLLPTRHYLYCRPGQAGAPDCTRRILRRGLFNLLPPGAYLIHARKQVYRPILPRSRFATLLRKRRRVLAGVAQPTTREVP